MDPNDYSDETSDEDYMPGKADCIQLSEEESGEDSEGLLDEDCSTKQKRKGKRSKGKTKGKKKLKVNDEKEDNEPEIKILTAEDEKKKTDLLWADFLKDTDVKLKPKTEGIVKKEETIVSPLKPKTAKVEPKVFEFAGETVSYPDISEKLTVTEGPSQNMLAISKPTPSKRGRGGMSSILSQLGKKQKITTLEKSKLDWDRFKQEENIVDELHAHNKGKNGYLERQDFLQRADLRQFEIEKEARTIHRSNRS